MVKASNNPFECSPAVITIGGAGGFNTTVQWDGDTITVPVGYNGTIWNLTSNKFVTYSVVGTTLTVETNAETDDILDIKSN